MARVIDLRKKIKKEASKPTLPHKSLKKDDFTAAIQRPIPDAKAKPPQNLLQPKLSSVSLAQRPAVPQISWEAPSFYFNPQKRYLALIIIGLVSGGVALLFFQKDTLTAIFLLLASLVLILYSNKQPTVSQIVINQIGISVDDLTHYYKDLKSFWINYNPGSIKELSLESKKWYLPYIKVSIENRDPLLIRSFLINFLPEKEHENSLIDLIARKIGL